MGKQTSKQKKKGNAHHKVLDFFVHIQVNVFLCVSFYLFRHNIIVVRRQYANVGLMHYPDAVVNLHKGAVLVSTEQLREEGGLEQLMERLTAVGLQLSFAFVLIHNLGEVNGWVSGSLKMFGVLEIFFVNSLFVTQTCTCSFLTVQVSWRFYWYFVLLDLWISCSYCYVVTCNIFWDIAAGRVMHAKHT